MISSNVKPTNADQCVTDDGVINASNRLNPIFKAKTIAVIGASPRTDSVGYAVLNNLIRFGYKGIIYPINPSEKSVLGIRAYKSVLDVDDDIDLAVICLKNTLVPTVLEEAGKKGVKGVVVISSGFKEAGLEGARLEDKLKEIAAKYNMPLLGPNCLGIINTSEDVRMNATFYSSSPSQGNIAVISQSGALAVALLDYAADRGIGISKMVSLGNKAVINENDVLRSMCNDEDTKVITIYIEQLSNGHDFIELANQLTTYCGKPILALKAGVTAEGAKAASSHTGSLAGSVEVYNAIFSQAGVIKVDFTEELFDYASAFSKLKMPAGNRLAIVTNAGGPGIIATDTSIKYGLSIPQMSDHIKTALRAILPPQSNMNNPIDVLGDADYKRYYSVMQLLLKGDEIDALLVVATRQEMTDLNAIARSIVDAYKENDKPVLAAFCGISHNDPSVKLLENAGLPIYTFPESAVRALSLMYKYRIWMERPKTQIKRFNDVNSELVTQIIKEALANERHYLTDVESFKILAAYGFSIVKYGVAKTEDEAVKLAYGIRYPVVLKIISPDIVHKSDVGGVKIDIKDEFALREAYNDIIKSASLKVPNARIEGISVSEMVREGYETILGIKKDPLGSFIMFGSGGTAVELYKDVSFRLTPIRELGASRMINETKVIKLLNGFRGGVKGDVDALIETILRLSQLATDHPEITELDINPFKVLAAGKGGRVIDARIVVASQPSPTV